MKKQSEIAQEDKAKEEKAKAESQRRTPDLQRRMLSVLGAGELPTFMPLEKGGLVAVLENAQATGRLCKPGAVRERYLPQDAEPFLSSGAHRAARPRVGLGH